MTVQELIESGIIEMYCLDLASEEERVLVEKYAATHSSVQEEIRSIKDALALFAISSVTESVPPSLKEKIIKQLPGFEESKVMPPPISAKSSPAEWIEFLIENNFTEPGNYNDICFIELPETDAGYSYAVYAKPNSVIPDEVHNDHHEHLLICQGSCIMTMNGIERAYKMGDYLDVAPGIVHTAVVTGLETMIVIGQRRAA